MSTPAKENSRGDGGTVKTPSSVRARGEARGEEGKACPREIDSHVTPKCWIEEAWGGGSDDRTCGRRGVW